VSVFGFIASLLNFFIDASFCLSTFLTVFMVSVSYFEFSTQHIYIFGESKAKLVEDITNIISATIFIALEHLALGIVLFEVLRFTPFNTSLSIFLSVIAFIPLVKPSLVAMLVAPLVAWSSDHYLAPAVCCLLYAYGSSRIYDKYYSTVSLHVVIINLSVIFGIYQYGVTGIFYGPLLITLFQCVYAELFRTR
jgi:predicted PurR-regulated permease PerM